MKVGHMVIVFFSFLHITTLNQGYITCLLTSFIQTLDLSNKILLSIDFGFENDYADASIFNVNVKHLHEISFIFYFIALLLFIHGLGTSIPSYKFVILIHEEKGDL